MSGVDVWRCCLVLLFGVVVWCCCLALLLDVAVWRWCLALMLALVFALGVWRWRRCLALVLVIDVWRWCLALVYSCSDNETMLGAMSLFCDVTMCLCLIHWILGYIFRSHQMTLGETLGEALRMYSVCLLLWKILKCVFRGVWQLSEVSYLVDLLVVWGSTLGQIRSKITRVLREILDHTRF